MRIDLGLQRLQLIGFVGQLKLIFLNDQIVDRAGHPGDFAGEEPEFILALNVHMGIQLTDLYLLGKGDQLLDRPGKADGDQHSPDSAKHQEQHTNAGIEPGNGPRISIQILIGHQLNDVPFEQRSINLPVHDNPLEPVLFPGKMSARPACRKPAPALGHLLPDPVLLGCKQRLALFIQHIQPFRVRIVHRLHDPLQFGQPEIDRQIGQHIGAWRTVERKMGSEHRYRPRFAVRKSRPHPVLVIQVGHLDKRPVGSAGDRLRYVAAGLAPEQSAEQQVRLLICSDIQMNLEGVLVGKEQIIHLRRDNRPGIRRGCACGQILRIFCR
ncbi:hypothetical protein D3C73_923950 [compost metagenome]